MATILELLQSVQWNFVGSLGNATLKIQPDDEQAAAAQIRLSQAIELLKKGYAADDNFEQLIEKYGDFNDVPKKLPPLLPDPATDPSAWRPILYEPMTITSAAPPVVRLPSGRLINFDYVVAASDWNKSSAVDPFFRINFQGGLQWDIEDEDRAALLRFLEESKFYVDLREDDAKDETVESMDHMIGKIWHDYDPEVSMLEAGHVMRHSMDMIFDLLIKRDKRWVACPRNDKFAGGAFVVENKIFPGIAPVSVELDELFEFYTGFEDVNTFPYQLPLAVAEALVERLNALESIPD